MQFHDPRTDDMNTSTIRRALTLATVALAAGGFPAAAAAKGHHTYFVAPGGSGPTCASNSAASPFGTIQAALACVHAGDVITLAPSGATPYAGVGPVDVSVTITPAAGADARSVRIDQSRPSRGAGELVVGAGATVLVQGVTLDCNSACLVQNVVNHGTLTLQGVTVTGANNGAIRQAPLAGTPARLTVRDSAIVHNSNVQGFTGNDGGGISSGATGGTGASVIQVSNTTMRTTARP